ncbi:MAG TPA: septum formation initiator family protein [Candidatus Levybacteria bacterium]|nr:septum formation initiator family protein [Candidatus Levybacteria bacterium]
MNIKTIITAIVIIILLVLIRNIVVSIYTLIQNEGHVQDLQTQLQEENKQHAFLNQQLSEVKSDVFVEKEARSKLGLVQENEYPVFIAPPSPTPAFTQEISEPNWKKWKEVFRL